MNCHSTAGKPTTRDRRYGWIIVGLVLRVGMHVVARVVYPPQLTGRTGWWYKIR